MKVVATFHILISYTFQDISRQRALWSGRVESGRFIVLNESASPKMANFISSFSEFFIGSKAA